MLGPTYNYTNELAPPSEIGVRTGGSFDDVAGAMAGVNYYIDAIGFGQSTGFAKSRGLQNQALGARYFMKTGMKCSNGADMYEYIDNVPIFILFCDLVFLSRVIKQTLFLPRKKE